MEMLSVDIQGGCACPCLGSLHSQRLLQRVKGSTNQPGCSGPQSCFPQTTKDMRDWTWSHSVTLTSTGQKAFYPFFPSLPLLYISQMNSCVTQWFDLILKITFLLLLMMVLQSQEILCVSRNIICLSPLRSPVVT